MILERECAARAFELSVLGMRNGVLLLSGKKGIFPGYRDTTVNPGKPGMVGRYVNVVLTLEWYCVPVYQVRNASTTKL